MGDGHFSPAGIDCSHICLVLLSSYTAHSRAEGKPHTQENTRDTLQDRPNTLTDRRHSNLTARGV